MRKSRSLRFGAPAGSLAAFPYLLLELFAFLRCQIFPVEPLTCSQASGLLRKFFLLIISQSHSYLLGAGQPQQIAARQPSGRGDRSRAGHNSVLEPEWMHGKHAILTLPRVALFRPAPELGSEQLKRTPWFLRFKTVVLRRQPSGPYPYPGIRETGVLVWRSRVQESCEYRETTSVHGPG